MAVPNTTPTPNELYNGEMKKMNDTELRVVLLVTRATLGWEIDHETGMRKQEDWISQKQLMEKSGKSNRSISTAVKSCVEHGWIEARDKSGLILQTPEERSGRRIYYRLGRIFLDRITSETSSQVKKPVKFTTRTSETDSLRPVKKLHTTKETLTKETLTKDIGAHAQTPADLMKRFCEEQEYRDEEAKRFIETLGYSEQVVKSEIPKFLLYWTEPTKNGTRMRWELQKTFEVRRRLVTWLSRQMASIKGNHGGSSKGKEFII